MSQTWTDTDNTSDDVPDGFTNVEAKLTTLRSNWSGTSAPGSPVEGQTYVDTTSATDPIPYFRANSAWVAWANLKCRANKDFNDFEAENIRMENVSPDPSGDAGKAGRLVFNTDDSMLKIDIGGSIERVVHGTQTASRILPMDDTGKDVSNPPTVASVSSSPTVQGLLFDATNEMYRFRFKVPANWAGSSDLSLKLDCVLNQNEVADEDIDWQMNWIAIASSEDADKTATNATSLTDIGNATTASEMVRCSLAFDYDDGTNPITTGDLIVAEVSRPSLASVGGVIVVAAHVEYTANHVG